jgi:AraC family transcriptional regulator
MQWSELFNKKNEPTDEQIQEFVATPLWGELSGYLQQTYKVNPKIEYSSCKMDNGAWQGWNVKYKKSGKSLCTLYPKQGYFLSLITIAEKDAAEADLIVPSCTDYIKEMYHRTEFGKNYGKMLGIEVTSEDILRDMKEFMALRVKK